MKTPWREREPEKYRESQRKYYAGHKEEMRQKNHRYYQENLEKEKLRNKEYYAKNRERQLEKSRKWRTENYQRMLQLNRMHNKKCRDRILDHYGRKCACCGEQNGKFLSVDHMNGNGAKHRKTIGGGSRLYSWIIRNNYPDGFQLLCYNCNLGKAFNRGICPHVEKKENQL
jgi:replicative superfamily II helicase